MVSFDWQFDLDNDAFENYLMKFSCKAKYSRHTQKLYSQGKQPERDRAEVGTGKGRDRRTAVLAASQDTSHVQDQPEPLPYSKSCAKTFKVEL